MDSDTIQKLEEMRVAASTLDRKIGDFLQSFENGRVPNGTVSDSLLEEKEARPKNLEWKEKRFIIRNSLLTDVSKLPHFHIVCNIFWAGLLLIAVNSIVHDLWEPGSFVLNLELFRWCFGKMPYVITIWLLMFMSTIVILFPCYNFWAHQCYTSKKADIVFFTAYVFYIVLMLVLPLKYIFRYDLPSASSMVVSCEQVRLIMKVHAFVRENMPRTFKYKAMMLHKDDDSAEDKDLIACPDFQRFLYFLFAPTLIYRDEYPRNNRVDWSYVCRCFLIVFACVFFVFYVLIHSCRPVFVNFNKEHISAQTFIVQSFNLILPGISCFVLGFFSLLHLWQNAFAEMLRFGDRLFYKDWWNATNLSTYYRTWNIVVYEWLYTYVYRDLYPLCGKKCRTLAMTVVFFLSAVVHEYIITVAFRFFYPVLFLQFFLGAGPVGLMSVLRSKKARFWNVLLWCFILFGTGMLMCFYSCEWYARQNCPPVYKNALDIFIPRSWTCQEGSTFTTADKVVLK